MLTIYRASRELRDFAVDVKGSAVLVVLGAFVGGLAQAAALFLAVRVALLNTSASTNEVPMPVIGGSLEPAESLILAGVLALGSVAANLVVASFSSRLSSVVLEKARAVTIHSYLAASWATQSKQRQGALQEAATTLCQRSAQLAQGISIAVAQTTSVAVFVGAALLVDPVSTAAVVASGAIIAFVLVPVARATKRRARAFVASNSHYAEEVSRVTSDTLELRAFGTTAAAEQAIAEVSTVVAGKFYRARFMTLLGTALFKDGAIILLIGCSAVLLRTETDTFASTGAVAVLSLRALAAAQQLNNALQNVNENSANLAQLNARNAAMLNDRRIEGTESIDAVGSLVISNVTFRYEDSAAGLDDISFTILRGEAMGVVGPSGSGKSTLLTLLLGLRHPSEGTIEINGVDLATVSTPSWTQLCSYVPQEPTLLNASVADNIRFYRDYSIEAVERAARDANVLTELLQLPEGLDTMLGPRGSGLSGGQKQRVAIARALIGEPDLLILDEPSSALDVNSERLLNDSLSRLKGKTSIVIATHKLETLKVCDRIIVLRDGRIEAHGEPGDASLRAFVAQPNGGPPT